jgi:hypothetical protein
MLKVTVREYAKHRGITERSARRYLSDGLIPEPAIIREGRFLFINQTAADKALNSSLTTRRQLLEGKPLPSAGKAAQKVKIETVQKGGTTGLSFHDARTLAQRHKTALLKIELDEKTGRLVDAEQVKVSAFNRARQVRDSLLNIPDRISPILAAEREERTVSAMLVKEIKIALEELTNRKEKRCLN